MAANIYLIEKCWIDPDENVYSNAIGYDPYGYMTDENKVKEFCESKGYFTHDDYPWPISKNDKVYKYTYREINFIDFIE